MKLILASASPWRKKILAKSGIEFEVQESGYEEHMGLPLPPPALARHLALGKALMVAKQHQDAVVLGADTFAVFRGKLLGKPHGKARAIQMLTALSGKTHTLITGFAIVDSKTGRTFTKTVATRVKMRKLSPTEIVAYVRTGESLKNAGGYAIQGKGEKLIASIVGDSNNVAGLPLAAVKKELAKFGVRV
ncbi:septum formation protein Maf [Candidatus Kaiserbacteria bacterium RIFCSPHIGHO2_01_FULL_54_36]|uniref:Nucleoside triphosphate pyrophosphatase n=1 Tax=Candidatus Kaiserbacteria bacterium RIFCSPHIGHO2_01_FULL_54_36 TaxID=1798482 RepID=A0A1F6CKQ6_9BACT|nr:MAG: septum formation protein Maf [Candidatus Kaiserbacteria bacterium RIFCSPHIGHO2_01_FULL_54_36]OGG75392.1 MAG: septum formation protein Maf [Candidatus Kaiserbacteria bacterium RIFCSPLOWO2_01_FULL_54_22]